MTNDCTNLVSDGETCGGCSKCYCACPYYIRDNMDLGCGGVCYEPYIPKDDVEEDNDEEDETECI